MSLLATKWAFLRFKFWRLQCPLHISSCDRDICPETSLRVQLDISPNNAFICSFLKDLLELATIASCNVICKCCIVSVGSEIRIKSNAIEFKTVLSVQRLQRRVARWSNRISLSPQGALRPSCIRHFHRIHARSFECFARASVKVDTCHPNPVRHQIERSSK